MSQEEFRKASCQHCGGRIAYPVAAEGTHILCPHCAKETVLLPAEAAPVSEPVAAVPPPVEEPPPAPGEIRIRVMDGPPKPPAAKPIAVRPVTTPPPAAKPERVVAKLRSQEKETHATEKPADEQVACRQCGTLGFSSQMRREGETWLCLSCEPARRGHAGVPRQLSVDVSPAGFWIRFAAKLIDGVILAGPVTGLAFALRPAQPKLKPLLQQIPWIPKDDLSLLLFCTLLAALPVFYLYQTLCVVKWGGTPGKLLLKLRVIDGLGGRPGWKQMSKRFFAELFLFCTLNLPFFQVDYIIAAFDPQKRTIHDWFAKTWVIGRKKAKPAPAPEPEEEAEIETEAAEAEATE